MNTEVALTPAQNLEAVVAQTQSELGNAVGDVAQAIATARGIKAIREALSDEVMKYLMSLMNNPLGFKTDKTDGSKGFYHVDVVRNCLIAGFMRGAKVVGNEINIIASQCYLTKEFFERKLGQLSHVKDLRWQIGTAARGQKTAAMPATATWVDARDGQQHLYECVMTEGFDGRIQVNCYETSSPDELHGKAESKLLRRIYKQISGIDIPESASTVQGSVVPAETVTKSIEQKTEPLEERIAKVPAAFEKLGVTLEMIEGKIGHPISQLTENGLDELTAEYLSISKGEVNAFEVFEFPPIAEDVIRKRFAGLKSKGGLMKAGKEFILQGADSDLIDNLITEYLDASKGDG